MKLKDLTGKIFGRLTVISYAGKGKWHCKCSCGTEKDIVGASLRNGVTKSCGCYNKDKIHYRALTNNDLAGRIFGNLTVISYAFTKDNRNYWKCRCKCGNVVDVATASLTSGNTKSCGCLIHEDSFEDLTGQKFGRLTVVSFNYKLNNKVYWNCICDCGNKTTVESTKLKSGKTKSCGCYRKESTYKRCFNNRAGNRQGMLTMLYSFKGNYHTMWHCKCDCGNEVDIDVCALNQGQQSCGCVCISQTGSKAENEIKDYILTLDSSLALSKDRVLQYDNARNKEIDIFIPSVNLGIEYNGSVYHASVNSLYKNKPKNYHQQKFLQAKEQGIHLINIFDVDWENNKDKIKMYLKSILTPTTRVFARKCRLTSIEKQVATDFCNKYHLQGFAKLGTINYGLYHDDKLVEVMSFGKVRFKVHQEGYYELHRLCTKDNVTVVGGASRLLKAFERDYKPVNLLSYSNNDYFTGEIYGKLGFGYIKQVSIPYYWFYRNKEVKRALCQISKLKIKYPDLYNQAIVNCAKNKEDYIMTELGACKVYRSGNTRWVKNYKLNENYCKIANDRIEKA